MAMFVDGFFFIQIQFAFINNLKNNRVKKKKINNVK